MVDVTVIICAHNPHRPFLQRVIEALKGQTLDRNLWELILVDNGSKEPICTWCDLSWHPMGICVSEPELGLASARRRGISQGRGSLVVFVDDDNVLASDYLERAYRIAREWPRLGAWGSGSISAEFEIEPALHLKPFLGFLGVREVAQPVWSNAISCTDATPIGAGLCIRRDVADAYMKFYEESKIKISGRKGTALGAHEDYEICYLACQAGLGMGIFPELRILHLIVKKRVSDAHILRLIEGVTSSHCILDYKWKGKVPSSPYSAHGLASLVLNIFRRRGFDRRVFFAELRAVNAARRTLFQLQKE
jgi:glycosyltransferase involved in cell wall biosynthesis